MLRMLLCQGEAFKGLKFSTNPDYEATLSLSDVPENGEIKMTRRDLWFLLLNNRDEYMARRKISKTRNKPGHVEIALPFGDADQFENVSRVYLYSHL